MNPKVAIVVPVLNAAGDLPRLLASLAALDWPRDRLECVIVDNGSADRSREVAIAAGVRVLDEPKPGSYAARNRGVRETRSDWVVFTDADCAPRPDWLRRLFADPVPADVGAIAGEVLALEAATPVQRFIESRGFMKHAVTLPHKELPCFSTANVAIRREVLDHLGGFSERSYYFGDMELSWRLQTVRGERLEFRPDAVVLHRHRRTAGGLWRQAVQHGRGVAFMKRTYPDLYRFSLGEQLRRLLGVGAAAVRVATGDDPDRWRAPGYLAIWYAGMAWGYVRGPAWVGEAAFSG
jgi:glycosyltransferase involved in cell wall biosynthesis